ncbi:transporter [Aquimarina sp. SS2-1]|uniref:transporter n=1 Tax=Aquimarina besae TaxID=3342247 RepID=UPI00366D0A10
MSPKSMLLLISLFLLGLMASAQYTEKINTNRPGVSQGAFSVGNNVLQLESGFGFGKEKHKLFDTRTNTFNLDYTVRYGLLIEQLEININGSFRSDGIKQTVGANEQKIRRTDFEFNNIGVKYLIYDPYKKPKDKDSINYDELKSWKERYRFKWKSLIPAVSAYVGMNYVNADNPFTFPEDQTISPKFVVMTQNNWWTSNAGSWVLVTNLIVDKITTENPAYGWIITSTHTINDKWAVFGEYQGQKSDFYSDNILRLGGAYLFNNDLQIDANIATNFKDTPSIFRVSVGASYRFDWHYKDEIIEKPGFESGIKKEDEDEEELNLKESDSLRIDQEFEEIENDSLKLEKTPFINEFEDGTHRDAMEEDLDKRRTEQRLERERIEKEKQDKKDDKKFRKEERRRLKREAKAAKQAEKAKIKAEKEKQKMIEDIDAELDKMEQDEGVDDELKKIDEELKKLEEMEKDLEPEDVKEKEEKKETEEEEDIDAEYEKLQKEQEKAKKEEEKRRKKEEKKRLKEEKKRKKEEEKRKKEEEKKKKEENENDDNNEG